MNRLMRRQAFFNACLGLSLFACGCSDNGNTPLAASRQRVPLPSVDGSEFRVTTEAAGVRPLSKNNSVKPDLMRVPPPTRIITASGESVDNIGPISEEEARQMEANHLGSAPLDESAIPPRNKPVGRLPLSLNGPEGNNAAAPNSAEATATPADSAPQINGTRRLPPADEESSSEPTKSSSLPSWQESRLSNYKTEPETNASTSAAPNEIPSLPTYGAANSPDISSTADTIRIQPSPEAVAALTDQCKGLLINAQRLAQRGAMFSARADIIQTERVIAQALDAMAGTDEHSQALSAANIALEEANDFMLRTGDSTGEVDVNRIADAHRTPVLKGGASRALSPVAALQMYYGYAQRQLIVATGKVPIASEAYYWHGKIHTAMIDATTGNTTSQNAKAMIFHQAALEVNSRNYLAANELGVLLARFGQFEEAKKFLIHSVSVKSHVDGWHNLSVVHTRLGEADLARRADYERGVALKVAANNRAANSPVRLVDAATFTAQNPNSPVPYSTRPANSNTANLPSSSARR